MPRRAQSSRLRSESESTSKTASTLMKNIYMVMNIYIYGTFEKESQWEGASFPADAITLITYMYIGI